MHAIAEVRVMGNLRDTLKRPLYLCIADYSDVQPSRCGVAVYGDGLTETLDDAADDLAECQREGREARVFLLMLPTDGLSDKAIDITAQCEAIIRQRCRERGIAAE
jgi:hypothetical protein